MNNVSAACNPGSSPAPDTAHWHADPTFRGTWGLISTCLGTLFICVWKAVHMDVPLRASPWNVLDKVGWLFVGVFAPDYLLYLACCQLRCACDLQEWAELHLEFVPDPPGYVVRVGKRVGDCIVGLGRRVGGCLAAVAKRAGNYLIVCLLLYQVGVTLNTSREYSCPSRW